MTPNPKIERLRYRQMQVRRLFARLRSECRSRSAIGSGGAQTHQTAAADRKDGARASAARSERHGATYLNAAIEDVSREAHRGLRRDLPPPGIDSGQRWVSIRVVTKPWK